MADSRIPDLWSQYFGFGGFLDWGDFYGFPRIYARFADSRFTLKDLDPDLGWDFPGIYGIAGFLSDLSYRFPSYLVPTLSESECQSWFEAKLSKDCLQLF